MSTIATDGTIIDPDQPFDRVLIVSVTDMKTEVLHIDELSDSDVVNVFLRVPQDEYPAQLVPSVQQDPEFMGDRVHELNATHEILITKPTPGYDPSGRLI